MENWDEFFKSESWWSFTIVPMKDRDMLLAVAAGDAEVKIMSDEFGEDAWFRWVKQPCARVLEYKQTR